MYCVTGWDHFDPQEVGFAELYQLFTLVAEQLGQDAIVIDADDLLHHPGIASDFNQYSFLSFCQVVSIPI